MLKHDERITDIPYPKDFFTKINVRQATAAKSGQIPWRTMIQLRPSASTVFPELLCTPVLLVTQAVQDIIKLYDESIVYRQVIYLNPKNKLGQLYFMPLLASIDCLSSRSEYVNVNKGAFAKVVLKEGPIKNETIFQVPNQTQRVIVIRLDLAEHLLTQGCKGFTLAEAGIEV